MDLPALSLAGRWCAMQTLAHQTVLKYFWARVLEDGETAECQFDLDTGEQRYWYPCAGRYTKLMWVPFDERLARLVAAQGERVEVSAGPAIEVELDPHREHEEIVPHPTSRMFWGCTYGFRREKYIGDRPVMHLEQHLHIVEYVHCHECGNDYELTADTKSQCTQCGASDWWLCRRCGEVELGQYVCKCGNVYEREGPYTGVQVVCPVCGATDMLPVGIRKSDEACLKLPDGQALCKDCLDRNMRYGLERVVVLERRLFSWLETKYVAGYEDGPELVVSDEGIRLRRGGGCAW